MWKHVVQCLQALTPPKYTHINIHIFLFCLFMEVMPPITNVVMRNSIHLTKIYEPTMDYVLAGYWRKLEKCRGVKKSLLLINSQSGDRGGQYENQVQRRGIDTMRKVWKHWQSRGEMCQWSIYQRQFRKQKMHYRGHCESLSDIKVRYTHFFWNLQISGN